MTCGAQLKSSGVQSSMPYRVAATCEFYDSVRLISRRYYPKRDIAVWRRRSRWRPFY